MSSRKGKAVWLKYVQQMRKWHEMRSGRQAGDIFMHNFLAMVSKLERGMA